MESNEEYLLRALRRTSSGLTDSLIPAHGAKLTKLLNKFEGAETVAGEVQTLMHVQGFGKCALAMEWLLERTNRTNDFFSPEQFESDVLLLNEKLFEAFLNQPFDMPDFSRTFEAPVRPIQHIQVSDDEFMGTSYPAQDPHSLSEQTTAEEPAPTRAFTEPTWDTNPAIADPFAATESVPVEEVQPAAEENSFSSVEETSGETAPSWETPSLENDPFHAALMASSSDDPKQDSDQSPSLKDSMTTDLFEATERVAQTAVEFLDKTPGERPVSMAVFRVTVRAASESAKSSSNVIAQDLLDSLLKLIAVADEQGKIKSDNFAHVIRDLGDRLTTALAQESGGITLLKNLTNYLKDPKELLSAR